MKLLDKNFFDTDTNILDENIINSSSNNFIFKKIKLRTLNNDDTKNVCNYNFFENINKYNKNNNNIVLISNIQIKDYLFNITPKGLFKISKDNFTGINEIKKKIKLIEESREKKEREKFDPGVDKERTGPER